MDVTLSQALEAPGLPHSVTLSMLCTQCSSLTPTRLRGVAVAQDALEPLGDLRCGSCNSAALTFTSADGQLVVSRINQLLQTSKKLPAGAEAFVRGSEFDFRTQRFNRASQLRATIEHQVQSTPDDAQQLLQCAAGMFVIRDVRRAVELADAAHQKSPDSPDPLLLKTEVLWSARQDEEAAQSAKEALARKDGPSLMPIDRAQRNQALARLVKVTSGQGDEAGAHKIGRNDPCPCGSGKKYKKCCGAAA